MLRHWRKQRASPLRMSTDVELRCRGQVRGDARRWNRQVPEHPWNGGASTSSARSDSSQASSSVADYGEVLWTHGMFVPKEDGIKLVASSLGCDESKIKVARASDVQSLISTEKIPNNIGNILPKDNRKVLLVCMAGGTSLRVA